jgi:hypothetical protein
MPRLLLGVSALLLPALMSTPSVALEQIEHSCRSGDLVRRVVVEAGNASTGLPCEVVYWKDTEAPGVRRVLWNARSDANFCSEKAQGLVDKLGQSGWQCNADSGTEVRSAEPAPAPAPSPTQADTEAQVPATTPLDQSFDAATAPAEAAPQPAPSPSPAAEQQFAAVPPSQEPPVAPSASNGNGDRRLVELDQVIAKNLESLNQSVDGDFVANIGEFGDLNRDGLDDAVVFFDYQSSTADFTQFVAAYLFNGEGYHLAATKPVGGTDRNVRKVEIESISDGTIWLRQQLNDPTHPGASRATLVLRDGQLVEQDQP